MDHTYIEEMNDGKGTNFHLYCTSHLQFIAWMNLLTSSASVKSQQHHLTFEPFKSTAKPLIIFDWRKITQLWTLFAL